MALGWRILGLRISIASAANNANASEPTIAYAMVINKEMGRMYVISLLSDHYCGCLGLFWKKILGQLSLVELFMYNWEFVYETIA
jgi:hypothetical protein